MGWLKNNWRDLMNVGIKPDASGFEMRKVRLLNTLSLVGTVIFLCYLIISLSIGNFAMLGLDAILLGICIVTVLFQKYGFYTLARIWFILVLNLVFVFLSIKLDHTKNIHISFVFLAVLPLLFFEGKIPVIMLLISTVFFCAVNYYYIQHQFVDMSDTEVFYSFLNPSFAFIFTYLIVWRLKFEYLKTEDLNKENTNTLKLQSEAINAQNEEIRTQNEELKEVTKRLYNSLDEKNVLLREVHHRVKNNLQIVLSLLNTQIRNIQDSQLAEAILQCQNRIQSMVLIHQSLYDTGNVAKLRMDKYINDMFKSFEYSYQKQVNTVNTNLDVDPIELDLGLAVPLGLIINELVGNAFKYAFLASSNGELHVKLKALEEEQDRYLLVISDNGQGLERTDITSYESLGLNLVQGLVNQIQGELDVDNKGGTKFEIRFSA
ncbi:MAG: histidine kinase dimerization/phosphoacceptor domain -containing protein [Bacteroidota bacterium]